jgi:hypothetical protein
MAKPQVRLRVIPEPDPDTRVIFHHDGPSTVALTGTNQSAPDLCCGACGAPLIRGIVELSVVGVVFRCYGCGAFSELSRAD